MLPGGRATPEGLAFVAALGTALYCWQGDGGRPWKLAVAGLFAAGAALWSLGDTGKVLGCFLHGAMLVFICWWANREWFDWG